MVDEKLKSMAREKFTAFLKTRKLRKNPDRIFILDKGF